MTTSDFIFNTPLYQKVTENVKEIVQDLFEPYNEYSSQNVTFDGYNPMRGKDSTFCVEKCLATRDDIQDRTFRSESFKRSDVWFCTLKCRRYGDKLELCIWFNSTEQSITKVGQYPSIADVHIGQIKKYNKILSKEDLKEFTRAIGLAANGVGIGSFVYLRRIFENLIEEACQKALQEGSIKKDEFLHLRMDEKIGTLEKYLPSTLVEIKHVYGILSKGIHALSENECLAYFDVVRTGIEIILDDKIEQKKKEEKKNEAIKKISALSSKLKESERE